MFKHSWGMLKHIWCGGYERGGVLNSSYVSLKYIGILSVLFASKPSSWFLLQHTCHHNHCRFHTFHIPCLWNLLWLTDYAIILLVMSNLTSSAHWCTLQLTVYTHVITYLSTFVIVGISESLLNSFPFDSILWHIYSITRTPEVPFGNYWVSNIIILPKAQQAQVFSQK